MRLGDLDRGVLAVREVQQRRAAAQGCRLLAEPVALGLGDVHHGDVGIGETQITRGHVVPALGVF